MKIRYFLILLFVAVLNACSNSYDKDICQQLEMKIQQGDELTQEDYSSMIKQSKAIAFELKAIEAKTKDDEDAQREYADDPAFKEKIRYLMTFGFMLEMADLDEANEAALKELKQELD